MFYEGLTGLVKTFWGTAKKSEKKLKLTFILTSFWMHGAGRVNVHGFPSSLKFQIMDTKQRGTGTDHIIHSNDKW